MNTEHLKYILAIAENHSINQAAERIHIQRQSLSKIVMSVEQHLGITIFERNSRGVELTSAGRYFVEQASRIVALTEELENHFQPQLNEYYPQYTEELTISFPLLSRNYMLLVNILDQFKEHFPNVNINIIQCGMVNTMESALSQSNVLGMIMYPANKPPKLSEGLSMIWLKNTLAVAIASASHPAARQYSTISVDQLNQYDLVAIEPDEDTPMLFQEVFAEHQKPNIKYRVGSSALLQKFLKTKQCFALDIYMPNDGNDWVQIPLEESPTIACSLLYHQEALQSFVCKAYIDLVLQCYHVPALA